MFIFKILYDIILKNKHEFKRLCKNDKTESEIIWKIKKDAIIYETDKVTSELSDNISKDLQKIGMKFVGSTIIYSYLQAIGIIYSHEKDCYLFQNNN